MSFESSALPFCSSFFCYVRYCETIWMSLKIIVLKVRWKWFSFGQKLPGWDIILRDIPFFGTNARSQKKAQFLSLHFQNEILPAEMKLVSPHLTSVQDHPIQLITLHLSSWPCTVSPEYAPTSLPFHAPNNAPKPKSSAPSESQPRTTRRPDHKATTPRKLPRSTGQSHHRYRSRGYNLGVQVLKSHQTQDKEKYGIPTKPFLQSS